MWSTVSLENVQLRDLGFIAVCIISVAAILLAQLVSLVVIDTTGLDAVLPGVVIYVLLPAALLSILPTALGVRLYGRSRGLWYGGAVFLAVVLASLLTVQLLLIG